MQPTPSHGHKQWRGLPAHPHLRDLINGHVQTLLHTVEDEDLEWLTEHLRILALEARGGSARPHWEATIKAMRPQVGRRAIWKSGDQNPPPAGLRLETQPGVGRVLVADRNFVPGEPLFTEKPVLVIPNCLLGQGNGQDSPGPIMREFAQSHTGLEPALDMDKLVEAFVTLTPATVRALKVLESHDGNRDFTAAVVAEEVAQIAVTRNLILNAAQGQELAWFIRVVSVNACAAPRVQGIAVFQWISMISHSCAPNLACSSDEVGPQDSVTPRATKHISSEDLISVSYISLQLLMASTTVRQEALKAQKGFLCMCERCLADDIVRVMPCPYCPMGGCTFGKPSPEEDPHWWCQKCSTAVAAEKLPMQEEERLLRFCSSFVAKDEQTLQSLMVVVDEDLGKPTVSTQHYLKAWLLLHLVRHLLRQLPASVVGSNAGSESGTVDAGLQGRLAVRAAMVLWRLAEWVGNFAPTCWDLLAVECGVPTVRALLASERNIEAVSLAAMFESALAASLGPCSFEVRMFGRLLLGMDRPPGTPIVTCERCGKPMLGGEELPQHINQRRAPDGSPDEKSPVRTKSSATPALPVAEWCRRCYLAPFCSHICQIKGRRNHDYICINAAGACRGEASRCHLPSSGACGLVADVEQCEELLPIACVICQQGVHSQLEPVCDG